MNTKCIWFINDYAGSKYHGMEFRNYNLAIELIKKGYKVFIISASFSHLFRKLPEITGEYTLEDIDGINYIWVKVPEYKSSTDKKRILKWFIFTKKLYALPSEMISKPDVIVASPMAPFLIMPVKHYVKRHKAKLIYDVKDIWPLTLMELGGFSKWHPLIWLMQRFSDYAYKKSDLTTSSLSNSFAYMKTRGLSEGKFRFIPNGVSLEDMTSSERLDPEVAKYIPANKFIVGYAGGFGIAKALDTFIQSAKYMNKNDIALVLVGDGKNKQELKELRQKMQLENVHFIDSIPKNQVQSLLKFFDVCYLATKKKDLYKYGVSQNKLYDYLYASKPILYGVNDENSIINRSGCGITVESDDPIGIASGVMQFYKMDSATRELMGAKGHEYVLEHHTYEKSAEKFINALEDL